MSLRLPVQSLVVLLRPDAQSPTLTETLTGTLTRIDPTSGSGKTYPHFGYDVVRLWDVPVQTFLSGGLATLPLAPLAKVTKTV